MVPCTSRSVYVLQKIFLHSETKPLWHLQNEQQGSAFLRHVHLFIQHFRQLQRIANSSGIGLASIFGVQRSSTSSNPYCVGSRRARPDKTSLRSVLSAHGLRWIVWNLQLQLSPKVRLVHGYARHSSRTPWGQRHRYLMTTIIRLILCVTTCITCGTIRASASSMGMLNSETPIPQEMARSGHKSETKRSLIPFYTKRL